MYLNFFNLNKEPFHITPDPELLYLSPGHKEALAAVIYGVSQRKGFIAIIGEVGVGKTTILRSFLERVGKQKIWTIYLFNPNISFKALLETIYQGLGHSVATDDVPELVDRLHRILIDEYKAGNNVALIIDEAQNMPVETLENLRMLSNLETSTEKLIQIVFSGQPEFATKLNLHSLRQLRQRIAIKATIAPLTDQESLAYIDYRLSRTVTGEPDLFSKGALKEISRRGKGIPRIINIICDNCLITSFGNQQKKVTRKVAREIIADLFAEKPRRKGWRLAAPAALAALLGLSWLFMDNALLLSGREPAAPPAIAAKQEKPDITRELRQESPPPAQAVSAGREMPEPPKETVSVSRVVKRGDTLAKLVGEAYGTVDKQRVELVKRSNPKIVDVNRIVEGEKIYFPVRK